MVRYEVQVMDEIKKEVAWIQHVLDRALQNLDGWELDDDTKREILDCLEDVEDEAGNFETSMIEIADRLEDAYNRATKENA